MFVLLKLTTDRHEASRGLFATSELLVMDARLLYFANDFIYLFFMAALFSGPG